jgi:hypothetical protein
MKTILQTYSSLQIFFTTLNIQVSLIIVSAPHFSVPIAHSRYIRFANMPVNTPDFGTVRAAYSTNVDFQLFVDVLHDSGDPTHAANAVKDRLGVRNLPRHYRKWLLMSIYYAVGDFVREQRGNPRRKTWLAIAELLSEITGLPYE